MEYAHRSTLVQVERALDDGFLHTIEGIQPVTKGSLIATNEFGNSFVVDDEYFCDNYVMVKKLRKPKTQRKSPFELAAIAEGYNCLNNQFEDKQYIDGTFEICKNK